AGALVDVMDALPHALRARGHEVAVALPFYREIRENPEFKEDDTGITVDVRVGEKTYIAEYLQGRSTSGVQLFFVRCDDFFDRAELYGEHGVQYEDNAARFIFFCKAAVELARRLNPSPQILHVHDWAAALVPVFRSKLTSRNISRAEARAASNYFSSGATIFLIGPSSTANTVCSTKTMPRALFFSAKPPWNWRAA